MTRYALGPRPDMRIQIHERSPGYTRQESAAEWVHFLDDDVIPELGYHPTAAGVVTFPCADSIFTGAVHVSGVA